MIQINVEKLNETYQKFIEDRDWHQFHSLKNLAMALSVESSELLEHFQWLTEEQSNQIANDPELKQKVAEEISDVFLYLMRIAVKSEIDIEASALQKLKKNAEKYPVDKARGIAKKYNEL